MYLYFFATTTLNDNITSDWLAPDGTVFTGGHWSPPVFGNYCYLGESQSIETTSQPDWFVASSCL